ncbi:MAG: ribosomal-protein-alanine acetyltransferase [Herpetosiphonaceae bacterium]|nr:MAG: ribosomal-protein-alanine acetyltransferase [Herpetosiphonaceae bacterium]
MYYFIEPMREEDIPAVQEIERQSFSSPWSANTYRRELRSPETSRYIVARASPTPLTEPPALLQHQRRGLLATLLPGLFSQRQELSPYPIIGYGGVWLMVDEGHITTIAVDPKERGKGVGELLLNALIDQAYDLGASILTLEVRISNTTAQNLYLKYGFQPAGTRPRYYTDNNEDALIMWTENIHSPAFKVRLKELRAHLAARLQAQASLSRMRE